MGLLSRFFGKSSDLENKLVKFYSNMIKELTNIPLAQANDIANHLMSQVKEESRCEGSSELPSNFGDLLLERESIDEDVKRMLAKKRSEGVRDEDIRYWWNMNDFERRMIIKIDDWCRLALFIKLREEDGFTPDSAMTRVRRSNPIFGDPEDTTNASGQDRPLPYELKDRISGYIIRRCRPDPRVFQQELEQYSSCNALIREEMSKGAI